MAVELLQYARSYVVPGHLVQQIQYHPDGRLFYNMWTAFIAIQSGGILDPPDFLSDKLEKVAVGLDDHRLKAVVGKMLLIEIAIKAGGIVIGLKMRQAAKRRSDQQLAAAFQQSEEFLYGQHRIGQLLEHLFTQYHIEGVVRFKDIYNVANNIQIGVIPFAHLQTDIVADAIVLPKILGYILQMRAIFLVLLFACTGIQNAQASRKPG